MKFDLGEILPRNYIFQSKYNGHFIVSFVAKNCEYCSLHD